MNYVDIGENFRKIIDTICNLHWFCGGNYIYIDTSLDKIVWPFHEEKSD